MWQQKLVHFGACWVLRYFSDGSICSIWQLDIQVWNSGIKMRAIKTFRAYSYISEIWCYGSNNNKIHQGYCVKSCSSEHGPCTSVKASIQDGPHLQVFMTFCGLLPHWKRLTCITSRMLYKWQCDFWGWVIKDTVVFFCSPESLALWEVNCQVLRTMK